MKSVAPFPLLRHLGFTNMWSNLPIVLHMMRPCSLLPPVSDIGGSHLYVACRSVCDRNQVFWSAKSVLDRLIIPFWGSWSLDFQGSKVKLQLCVLDCWFLAVLRSPWSLDRPPQKGFDRLIQFWSWSQTLLHGTYKWLPLVEVTKAYPYIQAWFLSVQRRVWVRG